MWLPACGAIDTSRSVVYIAESLCALESHLQADFPITIRGFSCTLRRRFAMDNRHPLLRKLTWFVIVLLGASIVLIGYSWIVVSKYRTLTVQTAPIPPDYAEFRGAVHIHTTYAEGLGTRESILAAAKRAQLDFIAITDHNTMACWQNERVRNAGEPLLLKGIEISTTAGHLLGIGLQKPHTEFSRNPQTAIDEVRSLDGTAVLSHPTREEQRWRDPTVERFAGMEILNMNNVLSGVPFHKKFLILPQAWINEVGTLSSILEVEPDAVALWDSLNSRRPTIGFCGADAHGPTFFGVPSYESVFRAASLHLVMRKGGTDSLTEDLARRLLGMGCFYIAIDGIASSSYVDFRLVGGDTTCIGMGERCNNIPGSARLKFDARVPEDAIIRLMRNGVPYMTFENPHFDVPLELPGAYRVEIVIPKEHNPFGNDRIWVVTNHIYTLKFPRV